MAAPLSDLIWSVADLLRGDYKQSDYGKVTLPFTLLLRLDCVLESTKAAVLTALKEHKGESELQVERVLTKASKYAFYNTSRHTLAPMLSDPDQIRQNLLQCVNSFSANAQDIFANLKAKKRKGNEAFGYRTITVEHPLSEIDGDLKAKTEKSMKLLGEISE